ncbi:UNVERIFIED_CONTAM: hypothetical protein K2H54_057613 [Gekko kuhli]
MLAVFVGVKVASLSVSLHSVGSYIVRNTMYQKESAVQYAKIQFLQLVTRLAVMLMARFKHTVIAGGKMIALSASVSMESPIVLLQPVDRIA